MVCYFGFRIVGVLLVVSSTLGDNLIANLVDTKLPTTLYLSTPYYDGESDFIYLIGGNTGTAISRSVLRFNIFTETIEEMASLPTGSFGSPLQADCSGNLFYFDIMNSPYEVYKYDIANNSLKTVGELSVDTYRSASAKNSAGNILIMGGSLGTDIMEIKIHSEDVSSRVAGQFPKIIPSAVAVKVSNNKALVFGSGENFTYLELDLTTLDTKDVANSSFPEFELGMTATSDGKYVYLFGGGFVGPDNPGDGIIRLDPATHSWEYLPVQDFPYILWYRFQVAPAVVWVEKLNRIYLFGGYLRRIIDNPIFLNTDDIYYIDLDPQSPTTTQPTVTTTEVSPSTTLDPMLFSCDNRTDGTHPHPSDCSNYIACRNGTLAGVHPCFPPLLYDPITRNCNVPSLVDCELTCEDREDGTYPHPHDCGLFIICFNRDLIVSWCDPPLLFDPKELRCTLPELVQCADL